MKKLSQELQATSQLFIAPTTRQTYLEAFSLTGKIIGSLLSLAWLALCSISLIFFWAGGYLRQLIANASVYYLAFKNQESQNFYHYFIASLKELLRILFSSSIESAKSQLDVSNDPPKLPKIPTVLIEGHNSFSQHCKEEDVEPGKYDTDKKDIADTSVDVSKPEVQEEAQSE